MKPEVLKEKFVISEEELKDKSEQLVVIRHNEELSYNTKKWHNRFKIWNEIKKTQN